MHVVRPSVRPSVCPSETFVDQDHIGWKSWKLIARTISPTPSPFVAQRSSTYFPGEHGEILGRLEVGWEKVACWNTKAAISLKRVKIDEKLPCEQKPVKNFAENAAGIFTGPSEQKPIKTFGEKGAWAYAGTAQNFLSTPYYLRNG